MLLLFYAIIAPQYLYVLPATLHAQPQQQTRASKHHLAPAINISIGAYPPIPSLIGIGPEKCGTTSFAAHLARFPEMVLPSSSPSSVAMELRLWLHCGSADLNASLARVTRANKDAKDKCSLKRYTRCWSVRFDDVRTRAWNSESESESARSLYFYFEKSPSYWNYPHVAFLFSRFLVSQNTKLLILLRSPKRRTHSYFVLQSLLNRLVTRDFADFIAQSMANAYIAQMQSVLSKHENVQNVRSELLSVWRGYVYANGHNSVSLNGAFEWDANPWFSVGASCYVAPLLMWLTHVPHSHMRIVQSEALFDRYEARERQRVFHALRCWLRSGYVQTDASHEQCVDRLESEDEVNVTMPRLRSVSHFDESQKHLQALTNTSAVYERYTWFYEVCNLRLRQLLETEPFSEMVLTPFEWDAW